jgi:hypothetical protein
MFLTISSGQLKAQALDSTVRGIRRGLNIIKWLSIDSILQYKGMVAQFVAESQCYLCPECSYARSWLLRPTPRDCDTAADRGIECSFRGWCVVWISTKNCFRYHRLIITDVSSMDCLMHVTTVCIATLKLSISTLGGSYPNIYTSIGRPS